MRRKKKQGKSNRRKTKLGLPDLEHAKSAVLVSLRSPESQRSYRRSIQDFVCWYCSEPRLSFNKTVVTRYRIYLEDQLLAPGTINVRLAAVRRLAYEAADTGLLSPELAAGIRRVRGAKKLGMRLGNWLTVEEARSLWQLPNAHTLKGKRDRAILAVLLGCGLRRGELIDLMFDHIQRREDHWAIVDLVGNPMARPLDDIFRTRTNENGYVQQEWNDILLKREILQLIAAGRVREEPCEPSPTFSGRPEAIAITSYKPTSRYQSGQLHPTSFLPNFRVADRTITKAKERGRSGSLSQKRCGGLETGVAECANLFARSTLSGSWRAERAEAFLLNPQPLPARIAYEWGVVAEVVPSGKALSRARELAELYLKAPEVTRRNTRIHFIQPLKERIVREVGYGLSLEGASSADLVKSIKAKSEPVAGKGKSA